MSTHDPDRHDDDSDEELERLYLELLKQEGISDSSIISSPSSWQENIPPELQRRVNVEADKQRRMARLLMGAEAGGTMNYRLQSDQVECKILSPNIKNAVAMRERHNEHLVLYDFITLVSKCAVTNVPQYKNKFMDLVKSAKEFGLFIFSYTDEEMYERLAFKYSSGAQKFLIVEGRAGHPDPANSLHGKKNRGADCHIHLPDIQPDAKSVVASLQQGDDIKDPDWVRFVMEQQPRRIASIDDISCIRSLSHLGLASHTLHATLSAIISHVNPQRRDCEIDYVTAEIATLQGIITPNGKEIRLSRDLQLPPLNNGRSDYVFEHFRHERWTPFTNAYVRRNCKHMFTLRNKKKELVSYGIIADWWGKYAARIHS